MRIIYQKKEVLYPRFGRVLSADQLASVREDLPGRMKDFVVFHELYHLKDRSRWWVWREIKANAYGALHEPVGFLVCVLLSLQPYRLKYYMNRLIGRGE
jgi:hypothetical protein